MYRLVCLAAALALWPNDTWAAPSENRGRARHGRKWSQHRQRPVKKATPERKLRVYTAPAPVMTITEPPPPARPAPPTAPPAKPAAAAPAPPTAAPAPARPATGGGLSPEDQRALERALSADKAADSKPGQMPTFGSVLAPLGERNATVKSALSLNPDISAIVDLGGGYYSTPTLTTGAPFPVIKSGDDPAATGFNVQEVELAFQATVDPYFRADIYLTIPNLAGLEVEEAVLTTTSLPGSLQLRAGIFRAPFGRQNMQHLHIQDFTRRPTMNAIFLGTDGLRAPGLELSWLVPIPYYLLITGAAFSVAPPDVAPDVSGVAFASFGGGKPWDFTYLGNIRSFAQVTENTSALFGASFATGLISAFGVPPGGLGNVALRSYVYGADFYLKWKPPNQEQTYLSLAWQSEFYLRHVPNATDLVSPKGLLEGAVYSQLVLQVARRWFLGVRGEIDGLPSDAEVPRQYAGALSATWALSEFSRVRTYAEARYYSPWSADFPLAGKPQGWSGAAFLQFEAAIGAHGAHPY